MKPPVRTLLKTEDGRLLRVIDQLPRSGATVLIDTVAKNALPSIWNAPEVAQNIAANKWTICLPPKKRKQRTGERTADAQRLDADRWFAAKIMLGDERLYRRQTRQLALDLAHDLTGKSFVFLRNALRLAWQGGMTPESVRTGGAGKTGRGPVDGLARGRKPTLADYEPHQWDMKLYRKVSRFAKRKYKSSKLETHQSVYYSVLERYYRFVDDHGELQILPPGGGPSLRQIRSILETIPRPELLKAREGVSTFDNDYKPMIGCVMDDCLGPGHTYEIDASQVDHWVLSRELGKVKHVIGKATLYLVVDRFSRLIVGWSVSLDPPSWTGAMQAILSICEDKEAMCTRHRVKYDPQHWPAHCLMPARFFADRGSEMTGVNSDLIVDGLGIKVTNARATWAAAKGMVECSFKLVHVRLKAMNAGYDPAYNIRKRRAVKHYKNAKLNIAGLRTKLFQAIVHHNKSVHKAYQLHPDDIRDGIQPIPVQIYSRGLEQYGRPSTFAESEVRFHLLPEDGAAIHQEGIWYDGVMYAVQDTAKNNNWLTRAAEKKVIPVRIRHVPGLIDTIYVVDFEDPSIYYLCTLRSKYAAYAGMSRYELLNLEQVRKENAFWGERHNTLLGVRQIAENRKDGLLEKTTPAIKSKGIKALRTADRRSDRAENLTLPPAPTRSSPLTLDALSQGNQAAVTGAPDEDRPIGNVIAFPTPGAARTDAAPPDAAASGVGPAYVDGATPEPAPGTPVEQRPEGAANTVVTAESSGTHSTSASPPSPFPAVRSVASIARDRLLKRTRSPSNA